MHVRPFRVLPIVALVAAALVAAPWPDGEITGKDREVVARLTRGGIQRLDAEAGHGVHDAGEHAVVADPAAQPPAVGITTAVDGTTFAVLSSAVPSLTPPTASRLPIVEWRPSHATAPPTRPTRARGPPTA